MTQSSNSPILVRPSPVSVIFPLRHLILRPGLPPEAGQYEQDPDPQTLHLGAFAGDRLVGCVTAYREALDAEPSWRLRGMAVAADAQGLGVGRLLLAGVDRHVAVNAPPFIWCHARLPAVGFYERCGWTAISDVYDIPTVGPHRKMVRKIEAAIPVA